MAMPFNKDSCVNLKLVIAEVIRWSRAFFLYLVYKRAYGDLTVLPLMSSTLRHGW